MDITNDKKEKKITIKMEQLGIWNWFIVPNLLTIAAKSPE